MEKKINLIVKAIDKNLRVDVFINKKENEISRTRIKNLILNKKLKLNDKTLEDPSKKVSTDDVLELTIPEPKKASLKPYKFKLNICYEDEDLIVLNKPAGIVMHPGAGNFDNTIVNALIDYNKSSLSNIGDELRPGIVHRIDKNTSGILLIAKSKEVAQSITMLFKENKIKKKYLTVVEGKLKKRIGKITLPITKKKIAGLEKMFIDPESKEKAETSYKVIDYKKGLSLLEVYPKTGRKHQIRVHLQSINHPILGDNKYNKTNDEYKEVSSEKMHLHAKEVQLVLNNNKYFFKASLPNFFKETIKKYNFENKTYE